MTILTQVLTVKSWLYREHYMFLKDKREMKQSLGLGSGSSCLLARAVGPAGVPGAVCRAEVCLLGLSEGEFRKLEWPSNVCLVFLILGPVCQ